MGRYRFANNKEHGFSHVHVDERQFTVKMIGIDNGMPKEVYRVTVYNDGRLAQQ